MVNKNKCKCKLPDKIIALPNKDKCWHEEWEDGDNMLDFPHPFRGLLAGNPNVGKSTVCKNILLRQDPPFEEVFVIHLDADFTEEYEDIGEDVIMLDSIPSPQTWSGKKKSLVILDDLEFKGMSKEQKANLDRLFGYVSTHKNISVLCCTQDIFNITPNIRRCSNLFVLWRSNDMVSMKMIAQKVGLKPEQFDYIFQNLIKEKRDSLWVDNTVGSPYPYRINGFIPIDIPK